MNQLEELLLDYEKVLTELLHSAVNGRSSQVVSVLVMRANLARAIADHPALAPELLQKVAQLDHMLKKSVKVTQPEAGGAESKAFMVTVSSSDDGQVAKPPAEGKTGGPPQVSEGTGSQAPAAEAAAATPALVPKALTLPSVEQLSFADWREATQPPTDTAWWWLLDTRPADEAQVKSIRNILPWIYIALVWVAIALSLSFIVEFVRRLLIGGGDTLSTVAQGVVGLLAGSALIQFVWQLMEGIPHTNQGLRITFKQKLLRRFAACLVLIAVGLQVFQGWMMGYFSVPAAKVRDFGTELCVAKIMMTMTEKI